jgi:hypothetical protein
VPGCLVVLMPAARTAAGVSLGMVRTVMKPSSTTTRAGIVAVARFAARNTVDRIGMEVGKDCAVAVGAGRPKEAVCDNLVVRQAPRSSVLIGIHWT